MEDIATKKYKVLGEIFPTDENGEKKEEALEIGSIQELSIEIGDKFVEDGLAEEFIEEDKKPEGDKQPEGGEAPAPRTEPASTPTQTTTPNADATAEKPAEGTKEGGFIGGHSMKDN